MEGHRPATIMAGLGYSSFGPAGHFLECQSWPTSAPKAWPTALPFSAPGASVRAFPQAVVGASLGSRLLCLEIAGNILVSGFLVGMVWIRSDQFRSQLPYACRHEGEAKFRTLSLIVVVTLSLPEEQPLRWLRRLESRCHPMGSVCDRGNMAH
jgi:hypothetical protein